MTTFDIDGFRQIVGNHWRHQSPCAHLNWSIFERDDGIWQVEVAPVFQEVFGGEDDGKKVWAGFEFSLSGLFADEGMFALEFGAVSYCVDCNATPIIAVRGRYEGVPFVLKLHLEPIPESEPVEIIDTLKNETRAIRGRQP
jgi:hypothetical protein